MNSLAQIIQLIATAVNSKLTLKLSQQIAAISLSTQKGPGWIDRTAAGRSIAKRKIQASESRMKDSSQEHDLARTQAQQSAAEWLQESLAPTGKDLAALAATAQEYRLKMEAAAKELDRVTKEHFAIKASQVSERQVQRTERSDETVRVATEDRDQLHSKYSSVRQAVTEEKTNPTGMDPAILAHMEAAAESYEKQLGLANQSLADVVREQQALRAAIDAQIQALEGFSPEDLQKHDRSAQKVESATQVRNQAQSKFNQARDALTNEFVSPTGKTDAQLVKMAESVAKYQEELDKATATLKRVTEAEQATQKSLISGAKNQKIADERKPQSKFAEAFRKVRTNLRRMLGSRGRKALKGAEKRFDQVAEKAKAIRDPKAAKKKAEDLREKADEAKQRHAEAAERHSKNTQQHKASPTSQAAEALEESGAAVDAAAETAEAAEGMAAAAEGAAGLAAVLGPVGVAISVATAAIAVGIQVVKSAVDVVLSQLHAGQQEVERMRAERIRFSGSVGQAVLRYDLQSLKLEQRSSSATKGSGKELVEATMRLRESLQGQSEKWENLTNTVQATILDLITALNNVGKRVAGAFEFAAPVLTASMEAAIQTAFTMIGLGPLGMSIVGSLKFIGAKVEQVEKNTKKDDEGTGLQGLLELERTNRKAIPFGRQNAGLPPLK